MLPERPRRPRTVDELVDRMFADVFSEDQRIALRSRVAAWEAANPGAKASVRVEAWIDIAYAFQAERDAGPEAD